MSVMGGGAGRRGAARRLAAVAAATLAVAAAAAACSEATTDPNAAVSIAFDSLVGPVVIGDTLRDPVTGAIVPLSATAFNGKGDTIHGAKFTFFARDTTGALQFHGDTLVATDAAKSNSTVTIYASLNGLQLTKPAFIVPRPDSLARAADSVGPTFALVLPDDSTNVTPDTLKVKVLHDSAGVMQPVSRWVVTYEVESAAPEVADSVRLVATIPVHLTTPASPRDTTDASGLASRRLRVYAKAGAAKGTVGTVVVKVTATYRGANVRGSPLRFQVPLRI